MRAGHQEALMNERLANWEELDPTSTELTGYGESAEAHSKILVVLGDHFQRVQDLGDRIWETIAARLRNFANLAQFEDPAKLVVAVELIERIDRFEDRERTRRIAQGEVPEKVEMELPPNKRRNDALRIIEQAMTNSVREALPAVLLESVKERNDADSSDEDESDSDVDGQGTYHMVTKSHVPKFLEAGAFLMKELQSMAEDVARCFPPHYAIVSLYRWALESRLIELLRPVWSGASIAASERLRLIAWLATYLQVVEELSVAAIAGGELDTEHERNALSLGAQYAWMSEEAATARIKELNRECDAMMAQYIEEARPRLNGYIDAILRRNNVPEAALDGHLKTAIPEDLFLTLTEELNVLTAHEIEGKHMASFIQRGLLETLRNFQEVQVHTISKLQPETEGAFESNMQLERCCAFMNDFERMYDLCDQTLGNNIRSAVGDRSANSDALVAEVQDALDHVAADFIRGVESGNARIVQEVFEELGKQGITAELFTPAWETGAAVPAESICVTFEDYFDDPQAGLRVWLGSELLFGRTVALAFTELVKQYVHQLLGKTERFMNRDEAVERLRADAAGIQRTFAKYLDVLRFGKIKTRDAFIGKLAILGNMADVLEDPVPYNHFESVAGEFGAFAPQAISRLLFLRGDLSYEDREELKLFYMNEYASAASGTGRFDLSALPPIEEATVTGHGPKEIDPKALKRKMKARKKLKKNLDAMKRASVKPKSGPMLQMNMEDFLKGV
mmetsp:Transcript_19728/g.49855  ORF Transcript_19728/g.49855 Transcript_19728/m.49855 type:complete len:739 (+) Transcript_19728:1-2217(+)